MRALDRPPIAYPSDFWGVFMIWALIWRLITFPWRWGRQQIEQRTQGRLTPSQAWTLARIEEVTRSQSDVQIGFIVVDVYRYRGGNGRSGTVIYELRDMELVSIETREVNAARKTYVALTDRGRAVLRGEGDRLPLVGWR